MTESKNPEEMFPPRKGGNVETVRKESAQQASSPAAGNAPAPRKPKSVKVKDEPPAVYGSKTVVLPNTNSSYARVLGADKNRRRAVIIAVDYPIVVANNETQAEDSRNVGNDSGESAGGFILPTGQPGLTIYGGGEVWCSALTAVGTDPTRISVWSEAYAPEE